MNLRDKPSSRSALLLLPILSALSACAHVSTQPPATNSYCAVAKPIFYDSRVDSPRTVEQVETHNSVWACLCDNDCPKP